MYCLHPQTNVDPIMDKSMSKVSNIMNFDMSITLNTFLAVLLTFVVISVASYRVTRFLLFDSLVEGFRQKYYIFLGNNSMDYTGRKFKRFLAHKLLELSSCSWCLGVWVSAGLYWLWTWTSPLYWTRHEFILVAAIAGFQGLLHAFEPSDDE